MANTRLRRKGPDNLLLKEGSSHIAAEANLAVVAPPANPLPAVAPARMTNQEVAMIRQQVGKENHDMMLRMIQQVATVLSPMYETVTGLKPIVESTLTKGPLEVHKLDGREASVS